MRLRGLIITCAAAICLGAALVAPTVASAARPAAASTARPAAASAARPAAAGNHVSASLSGRQGHLRLTISINGQIAYDRPVRSAACGMLCMTAAVAPGHAAVRVVLGSDGQPIVLLGLYSGGAHCCFVDQAFTLDPGTMTFVRLEHNFLDSGATLTRLDGRLVFLSADARIAEAGFTDYADSGAPVQVWQLQGNRLTDVTRRYPSLVHHDAIRWMRAFRHDLDNGVGLIAAWAADEDLLGRQALVRSTLAADAAKGILRSALGLPGSQRQFAAELQRLLRQLGYTR